MRPNSCSSGGFRKAGCSRSIPQRPSRFMLWKQTRRVCPDAIQVVRLEGERNMPYYLSYRRPSPPLTVPQPYQNGVNIHHAPSMGGQIVTHLVELLEDGIAFVDAFNGQFVCVQQV